MTSCPEPKWVLNNNGNSTADIREAYLSAHKAAASLLSALQNVHSDALHNRNYQTTTDPDVAVADREVLAEMFANVVEIQHYCMAGAARIVRQRNGL